MGMGNVDARVKVKGRGVKEQIVGVKLNKTMQDLETQIISF